MFFFVEDWYLIVTSLQNYCGNNFIKPKENNSDFVFAAICGIKDVERLQPFKDHKLRYIKIMSLRLNLDCFLF